MVEVLRLPRTLKKYNVAKGTPMNSAGIKSSTVDENLASLESLTHTKKKRKLRDCCRALLSGDHNKQKKKNFQSELSELDGDGM